MMVFFNSDSGTSGSHLSPLISSSSSVPWPGAIQSSSASTAIVALRLRALFDDGCKQSISFLTSQKCINAGQQFITY